jgi:phage regulator Rha-like protein
MFEITVCDLKRKCATVPEVANCDLKQRSITLRLMPKKPSTLAGTVKSRILILRRQRVILDSDLAELYGVSVKRLNEQVRRNRERFPADFMFRLTAKEDQILRSQIATSSQKHGGRRYPPYAFTEHGAIMAATVLNSKRAIEMSVFVVRAFVRMREMLLKNRQLAAKINELDRRLETHDTAIQDLIDAIKELMAPEESSRRKIGFQLPPAKS